MPRLTSSRVSELLHEARHDGAPLVCKNCGEFTTPAACVVSTFSDEVFCSENCQIAFDDAYGAYLAREMDAAAERYKAQTIQQRQRQSQAAQAWNQYAAEKSPLVATITCSGTSWCVSVPGRTMDGISSRHWAEVYARNMGYEIAPDQIAPANESPSA